MKKPIIAVAAIALVAAGAYYLSRSSEAPVAEQVSEDAPRESRGESGADAGRIVAASDSSVSLAIADGSVKAYEVSPSTVAFRIKPLSVQDIKAGDTVSVVSDPKTGQIVSVSVVGSEASIDMPSADDWYLVGTVEKASGGSLVVASKDGKSKDVSVGQGVALSRVERIDISRLSEGDAARVAWFSGEDGVLKAGGVYVESK